MNILKISRSFIIKNLNGILFYGSVVVLFVVTVAEFQSRENQKKSIEEICSQDPRFVRMKQDYVDMGLQLTHFRDSIKSEQRQKRR